MNHQCIKCKGRGICGRKICAISVKIGSQKKLNKTAKKDFFGETPNVFIGRYGYPNINVGLLSTENYQFNDAPQVWRSNPDYTIQKIVDLRTNLINSNFASKIKNDTSKELSVAKEISLSIKPVDVEINLNKKPFFNVSLNQDVLPHGPNVFLKKAQVTENLKVPTKVDKCVSDTDLLAADALKILSKKFDTHYLTKLLSVGNFGKEKNRKLVPTRWSITAVDDTIGKKLVSDIKNFRHSNLLAFYGSYFGNYYLIIVFPGNWSYELFETVVGENSSFATDYEDYNGRKQYAYNTAGGYYAARLAILEELKKRKIQGSVLALRFITNEYWAPLGVWVVREASRNAMNSKPIEFSSKELVLKYAELLIKKKFNFDLNQILKSSWLTNNIGKQKFLYDY